MYIDKYVHIYIYIYDRCNVLLVVLYVFCISWFPSAPTHRDLGKRGCVPKEGKSVAPKQESENGQHRKADGKLAHLVNLRGPGTKS